jgi:hypothetical protein
MAGHLRLVRDEPPKPRKKWRRSPTLSHEEQARIRAVLKHARALFGTWACLADAMRSTTERVERAARGTTVSADVAFRLSRALGKPLEALLRAPSDASTCPHCGAKRAP